MVLYDFLNSKEMFSKFQNLRRLPLLPSLLPHVPELHAALGSLLLL